MLFSSRRVQQSTSALITHYEAVKERLLLAWPNKQVAFTGPLSLAVVCELQCQYSNTCSFAATLPSLNC